MVEQKIDAIYQIEHILHLVLETVSQEYLVYVVMETENVVQFS